MLQYLSVMEAVKISHSQKRSTVQEFVLGDTS